MNYANLPLPEVRELPFDLGWAEWDKAKEQQDSGFMSLEPIKPVQSERSVLRAEVVR
jgi:hypothetical protein